MNDKNIRKINELVEHFENKGYNCKREVKSLFSKASDDILQDKLKLIDVCCRKDKEIFCAEIEDSQFQCVKNHRALEQTKSNWENKGYKVNVCQLGVDEDFEKVCQGISNNEDSIKNPATQIEKKNRIIKAEKKVVKLGLPKTRLAFGW